jgi:outer membrane protein assembly factor BamB
MIKHFFKYCSLLFLCSTVVAQSAIERKIIIQNGQFYFFTIDEETQLATLFSGSIKQKLNKAQKRVFPVGREQNDPLNPLCFDINGDEFVGTNWMLNSNNSRYEAIKRINIKNWSKTRSEWTIEDWAQVSFNQPILAPNEPWEKMLKDNNVLENTFFDLIKTDLTVMAVCNQGKLWISNFDGKAWKLRLETNHRFQHFFSLIDRSGGRIGLLDTEGNYFAINEKAQELTLIQKFQGDKQWLLIVDKDKAKNYIISADALPAGGFSTIVQLINDSAIEMIN